MRQQCLERCAQLWIICCQTRCLTKQIGSAPRIEHCQPGCEPVEDGAKLRVAEGCGGSQEGHIWAGDVRQTLLLTTQPGAEVPGVAIIVEARAAWEPIKEHRLPRMIGLCWLSFTQPALEPGLGLALREGDQPLLMDLL